MVDRNFKFWRTWLLWVTVVNMIAGLLIALLPDSLFFEFHTSAIEAHFFNGFMPDDANNLRKFLYAPMGGTIAGYFLMQFFIVRGPFRRGEMWAWHAVLWPVLLWFVADSSMSAYHGAYFNIWMINIWTLLLVGLPLLMTRRFFAEKQRERKQNNLNIRVSE